MTCNQFIPHNLSNISLKKHTVDKKMKNGAPNKKKRTKYLSQRMLKHTTIKVKVIVIKIRGIPKSFFYLI